jgi:hypothetical protein
MLGPQASLLGGIACRVWTSIDLKCIDRVPLAIRSHRCPKVVLTSKTARPPSASRPRFQQLLSRNDHTRRQGEATARGTEHPGSQSLANQ